MKKSITQNPITVYAIFLFAIFILLFFTKNIFANTQILLDDRSTRTDEVSELSSRLSELNTLQQTLTSSGSDAQSEIQGFSADFSEKDILDYIYAYASQLNAGDGRMVVREMNVDQGNKSDLGFDQANVTISAIFSSEAAMMQFLNFLLDPEGEFKFYIPSFEYPLNDSEGNLQIDIPAIIYYK